MMHKYIQEIVEELEAQHENSVLIEWVGKILNDMHRIATEEANIKQENKANELQKRVDAVVIEIEKLHLSGVIGWGAVKKLEQALKVSKN